MTMSNDKKRYSLDRGVATSQAISGKKEKREERGGKPDENPVSNVTKRGEEEQ